MTALDTSVAVAAFGEWHTLNDRVLPILDRGPAIPAHCLLETYSVLTGFPPPHRAPPQVVEEWISQTFPWVLPSPAVEDQSAVVGILSKAGKIGGTVYDALVALTVVRAGAGPLITADVRAAGIYDLVGVDVEFVS